MVTLTSLKKQNIGKNITEVAKKLAEIIGEKLQDLAK